MKTGNKNGSALLGAIVFPALVFNTAWSASNPSFYTPSDIFSLDCSPSYDSSYDKRFTYSKKYDIDVSVISRVYALDPSNRERPKISACISTKQFTWRFDFSEDGPKFVRLHFKPITYSGFNISKALFSVTSGPYTLITTSESSYSEYIPSNGYAIREFCINVDGQVLNVTFTPSSKVPGAFAFVNKIEIVSMPSKLYIKEDAPLPLVGQPTKYSMRNTTALEMMYRMNIGGDSVSGLEDTGMFRQWASDDYFMSIDGITSTIEAEVEIKWSSLVPAYTAPAQVYASARTVLQTAEGKRQARWLFPVDHGFYYLVRLHFCEISGKIKQDGERVFRIYINSQIVDDRADVFAWSHGADVPVYRDYYVNFSGYGEGIKYLSVAVGSSVNATRSTEYEGPILNGLEIFKLSDISRNLAGPHPFGIAVSPHPDYDEAEHGHDIVIAVRIAQGLLCTMSAMALLGYYYYFRFTPHSKQRESSQRLGHCRIFSLSETKLATNDFADGLLIGTGGFGTVYKGTIDGGTTNVAIKRANPRSHQGLTEFETEISMLSNVRHCHLVSLIGYSAEEKEMILVYEYMAQGTLSDHLYRKQKPPLPWKQRLKICIGAARGLHYLHTGGKHMIIHRDIKSTNILLDDKWVAKVSDFGLSKLGPNAMTESKTHVSTIVKGSFGYLDPEYYRRQKLTEKSDVYSFGVVLFEVLCARPAVIPVGEIDEEEHEKASLAEWAVLCCQLGTLDQIIDPYLKGKIAPECFKTFTDIARKCLEDRGSERPSMGDVLWNLELALQQQEVADLHEDQIREVTITNYDQHSIWFANSDPTPGVEFSELILPTGR